MQNNLLFVISHQPNPRFIKQINYFSQHKFNVSVIYFRREYLANLNDNIENSVKLYELDTIENGKYIQRIGKYLKSIFKIKKLLKTIQPNKIIITNTDILFLLLLNNITKYTNDIIMEISDLRSYTFRDGILNKIQRYIDSIIFKNYISKLIVTSFKFYEFYYKNKFQGKYFVLENKPLSSMLPSKVKKQKTNKLVVGIVGLLLDGKPHKALFEYAKTKDDIEVHIYGKGTFENQAKEYTSKYNNIKYFGEYDFFKDISNIYASLDIIYMSYDTTQNDTNITLALPNKLYEAMYFKVPIITTKGTYLAQRVKEYNIGCTIRCCNSDDIKNSINYLKTNNLENNFANIKEDDYIADIDYKNLVQYIKGNKC
jgi:glycosyltransferase involved in cell wall biosynthesis